MTGSASPFRPVVLAVWAGYVGETKPAAMSIIQSAVRNRLLGAMQAEDFALLQPHLQLRTVGLRDVLIEPGKAIDTVYFPETGLAAFASPSDVETEVGVVGREGLIGASVILDVDRVPLKAAGQIAGEGFSVPVPALLSAVHESWNLWNLFGRYAHVFMMQTASTAYANAHFSVEQRLARWLLMTHDRSDGDELELTHEFLATMLCVRRPGVTVATHVLEGNGLIKARRGRITITDRVKLAALAGNSYGLAEAEYERVISPKIEKADLRQAV